MIEDPEVASEAGAVWVRVWDGGGGGLVREATGDDGRSNKYIFPEFCMNASYLFV